MSRDRKNLQETLAELKLQFNSPITLALIIKTFEDHVKESIGCNNSYLNNHLGETELKNFLSGVVEDVFEVIQLENISGETLRIEGFIQEVRDKGYIKFNVFENGSYEEANLLLRDIYSKWNEIQLRKELCSDHIVLIKKAIIYLTSLKKVISAFIQEGDTHKVKFKNLADYRRFTEVAIVSIDSYIEVLKGQINELSAWIDNTLSAKVNMLMRADSSLRLLSKFAEWDKTYNGKQGDTEPKEYGRSNQSQMGDNFKY